MTTLNPNTDQVSFLAGIGNICLQWALLEHSLLLLIAAAENMPLDKTYTRYGTTDMMPRIRMAVRLVEEAKWPVRLVQRLKAIRTALQKEGLKGLAEQRNLFVHGVHAGTDVPGEFELTMVRWPKGDRVQIVTLVDAGHLGFRLGELSQEAYAIHSDFGVWKFGPGREINRDDQITSSHASIRKLRAHNIKRAIKLLFANLTP